MTGEEGETADIDWIRKNLGFVADQHRICVGITRSKFGLVIVGEHPEYVLGEQTQSSFTCVYLQILNMIVCATVALESFTLTHLLTNYRVQHL